MHSNPGLVGAINEGDILIGLIVSWDKVFVVVRWRRWTHALKKP